ncbi:MAG: hypothetical protein M0D55_06265 [Elusimicrobiota bacterium]|nr:MAG: hypothetical protein M0D55_06265 [Elusimicrobiota bacterium]
MTAKVKSVLTVASEALETAAGYALVAVGLYAAIFVDMTGGGSLWSNLRNMNEGGRDTPNATRVIKVATQVQEDKQHEDRILAVFDREQDKAEVAAVYRAPDAVEQRSSVEMTDSPADTQSGPAKSWKKSIKGEMRTFTVYGRGEQTTSASAAAGAVPVKDNVTIVAVDGAPAAAAAASPAASRPGMGSRLSSGRLAASETSRNVR